MGPIRYAFLTHNTSRSRKLASRSRDAMGPAYNGGVFSLNLEQDKGGYTLTRAAITGDSTACGIDASWLTKDKYNDVVCCVDEG